MASADRNSQGAQKGLPRALAIRASCSSPLSGLGGGGAARGHVYTSRSPVLGVAENICLKPLRPPPVLNAGVKAKAFIASLLRMSRSGMAFIPLLSLTRADASADGLPV